MVLSPDILYFLDRILFLCFEHSQIVMHLKTAQFFTIRSEIAEEVSAGNICTKFIRRMQGDYKIIIWMGSQSSVSAYCSSGIDALGLK